MNNGCRQSLGALLLVGAFTTIASAANLPASEKPALLRLLSESEYRNAIADIFGQDIVVSGRFEPARREEGLLAVGARSMHISGGTIDLYYAFARNIAEQVVAPRRRQTLFPCRPSDVKKSDDPCARAFFASTGRLLFRRSLDDTELAKEVDVAHEVAEKKDDFYAGISAVLSNMLLSPEFLYRIQVSESDPNDPNRTILDAFSRASVLSFYLWDTSPDTLLIDAAAKGELYTQKGLERQVDRMLASPRIERGVRAFFSDMLGFEEFETLSKDPKFFPRFTQPVIAQAREQTLRTIVEHVVRKHGDYRDLFTTPDTFLTRSLAAIYDVPITDGADNGEPDRWVPYSYPEGDPRAGILSQVSFVALHSPAARTSPTLRGKALRELLMCQHVPPPPGNVDFTKFEQSAATLTTTRERVFAHLKNPVCAGCHRIMDPIGLSLENFDSDGSYRKVEKGLQIDASAQLNGKKFEGSIGLAKVLHDDPAITSCVAQRSFAFAAGFTPNPNSPQWQQIEQRFRDSKYNVLVLMRQIAASELLYTVPVRAVASNPTAAH
jgi:hypothetical protein